MKSPGSGKRKRDLDRRHGNRERKPSHSEVPTCAVSLRLPTQGTGTQQGMRRGTEDSPREQGNHTNTTELAFIINYVDCMLKETRVLE